MERSIEFFVALTALVVGASHVVQAGTWVEAYAVLRRLGRPGAFANGALSLVPGAVVVAGHPVWAWPAVPLTVFGWLLVGKGAVCLLTPSVGLRSMERAPSRAGFVVGGVALMVIGGWAGYCAWAGGRV